MDNYIYNSLEHYFKVLETTGYYRYKDVYKLLVVIFWYHLLFEDYRGYATREHYRLIERGLNCLFGTSCLIPYMDYLKMGKLKLGEYAEILARTKAMEDLVGEYDQRILDNDALIADNTRRIDEASTRFDEDGQRLDTLENTKVIKKRVYVEDFDAPLNLSIDDAELSNSTDLEGD